MSGSLRVRMGRFTLPSSPLSLCNPFVRSTWTEERLDQWVQGLRKMHNDKPIDRENACWWFVHAAALVPAIDAHVKLLDAHNVPNREGLGSHFAGAGRIPDGAQTRGRIHCRRA